jgi:hypothetical protein
MVQQTQGYNENEMTSVGLLTFQSKHCRDFGRPFFLPLVFWPLLQEPLRIHREVFSFGTQVFVLL